MKSVIHLPSTRRVTPSLFGILTGLAIAVMASPLMAHGVTENDKAFIEPRASTSSPICIWAPNIW
jgi:hypothetical protein